MSNYESIPLIKRPLHRLDDKEKEKYGPKRSLLLALIFGLVALVGVKFISLKSFNDNDTGRNNKNVADVTFQTALIDARIQRWEDWKSSDSLQLESSSSSLDSLDETPNGTVKEDWFQQEAEQIVDWFEHMKEAWNKTERKEAAQIRQWIQQTKHALNNTEQNVASWVLDTEDKSAQWINHTSHDISKFEHEEAKEIGHWINETEHATYHWWNNTEHKVSGWVNHSEHAWNEFEHKEGEKIGNWVKKTEHKATDWLNDTEHEAAEWIENIEHDLDEFEHEEAEKIGDWMDKEERNAANWYHNVTHDTTALINHTETAISRMKKEESEKIRNWVAHTQQLLEETEHKAAGWLNNSEHKTVVWINGTEHYWDDVEHEEAEKIRNWIQHTKNVLNDTEQKALSWLNDTEFKTSAWMNHTEDILRDAEHKEENKIKDWIAHTEEILNETEHNTFTWINDTEYKASEWVVHTEHLLNDTEHNTSMWLNRSEHNTLEWWNDIIHGKKSDLLIYMNTSSAYKLLLDGVKHGEYALDYFLIQEGFDAQINQAYCAVATSAAIINSYRGMIDLPVDSFYDPYPYATQSDLFNNCTNQFVIHKNESYDGIFLAPGGLGMAQTKALLECHLESPTFNITVHHLEPTRIPIDVFRQEMKEALLNPSGRTMINFDRKSVGQAGGGHWSPIGEYIVITLNGFLPYLCPFISLTYFRCLFSAY